MGEERRPPSARVMLGALMLGLAEALEMNKREEPAIVETAVGGDGDPIDVFLDPDGHLAVARVRPWLRGARQ